MDSRVFGYARHIITVLAVQQRDKRFHPSISITRCGDRLAIHRSDIRSVVFASQSDALVHGADFAMRWVDLAEQAC